MDNARLVAERIRGTIAQFDIQYRETSFDVSVSVGLSFLAPRQSATDLVEAADQNLYAAKAQGQNCVVG